VERANRSTLAFHGWAGVFKAPSGWEKTGAHFMRHSTKGAKYTSPEGRSGEAEDLHAPVPRTWHIVEPCAEISALDPGETERSWLGDVAGLQARLVRDAPLTLKKSRQSGRTSRTASYTILSMFAQRFAQGLRMDGCG